MKKKSIVIVLLLAAVLVLAVAGGASAGKTVYWDRDDVVSASIDADNGFLRVTWDLSAAEFDHLACWIDGPGDYYQAQDSLPWYTCEWYPTYTAPPSGAYRVKIFACDADGRVLDRLQTRFVLP